MVLGRLEALFYLSKLLSAFTQPFTWVAVLFLLALWWQSCRPVAARRALVAALASGLLVGWLPLPDTLLRYLENWHTAPEAVAAGQLQSYTGLVVLGGGIERMPLWLGRDPVIRDNSAERMKVPVTLVRRHVHLRLLFTGGDGELWSQGVPPERMLFERAARTTYENAILSAAMPDVNKTQPWLLVTSAWHMPRALATFRAAGWNVTPYPVDYRTGSHTPWTEYSLGRGVLRWQTLLHEVVGLAAYAMAGRAAVF